MSGLPPLAELQKPADGLPINLSQAGGERNLRRQPGLPTGEPECVIGAVVPSRVHFSGKAQTQFVFARAVDKRENR